MRARASSGCCQEFTAPMIARFTDSRSCGLQKCARRAGGRAVNSDNTSGRRPDRRRSATGHAVAQRGDQLTSTPVQAQQLVERHGVADVMDRPASDANRVLMRPACSTGAGAAAVVDALARRAAACTSTLRRVQRPDSTAPRTLEADEIPWCGRGGRRRWRVRGPGSARTRPSASAALAVTPESMEMGRTPPAPCGRPANRPGSLAHRRPPVDVGCPAVPCATGLARRRLGRGSCRRGVEADDVGAEQAADSSPPRQLPEDPDSGKGICGRTRWSGPAAAAADAGTSCGW